MSTATRPSKYKAIFPGLGLKPTSSPSAIFFFSALTTAADDTNKVTLRTAPRHVDKVYAFPPGQHWCHSSTAVIAFYVDTFSGNLLVLRLC